MLILKLMSILMAAIMMSSASLLVGSEREIVDHKLISNLADEALESLEKMSNNYYARKIKHVMSVSEKTVSGKLYSIKMELARTVCTKGSKTSSSCEIQKGAPREICKVDIWKQPWTNSSKVTKSKCIKKHQDHQDPMILKKHEDNVSSFRPLLDHKSSMISLRKLQSQHSFKAFVKKHKKNYVSNEEYSQRYQIFKANMKKVQFLRETELGTGQYGSTFFSDLTEDEFKSRHLGLKPSNDPASDLPVAEIAPDIDLPVSFDWRKHGAVTPVKNQGSCGSCWAFSVTGNVEGQWKIKKGELLSLSEQELVDCDSLDHGCNGGLPSNAYKAIEKLGGLESEKDYEYEGDQEKCHFNKAKVKAFIKGGVSISKNETDMAKWLLKNGPISIGINANAMQFYMGGVSHPWSFLCSKNGIDHGVLIVGYGIHHYPLFKKDMPFWIIKNSWGPNWGESGYYRMYRGDNTCGVTEMATSSIVE